jgi:hypothetical protein
MVWLQRKQGKVMKMTTPMWIALTVTLAASSGGLAADKAKDAQPAKAAVAPSTAKAKAQPAHQEKSVLVTGSYIKRDIRRNGVITDGSSPVFVMDHQAIENTGAATLNQALTRQGLNR